jgi:hypothetical protein
MRCRRRIAAKALTRLEDALEAVTPVWDAATKSFVDRPDHKTRLAAVQIYLENTLGQPTRRCENITVTAAATKPDYELMLRRSPALREAARRALERAEQAAETEQAAARV